MKGRLMTKTLAVVVVAQADSSRTGPRVEQWVVGGPGDQPESWVRRAGGFGVNRHPGETWTQIR